MKQIQLSACIIFLCATALLAQTENPGTEDKKTDPIVNPSEPTKGVTSKSYKELYEDTETGQIFTKPGQGRRKIEYAKPLTASETTTLPDGFIHRPEDIKKEKCRSR